MPVLQEQKQVKGLTGMTIFAAKKGAAHAAGAAMVVGSGVEGYQVLPWFGHHMILM
jgi:hypothetical protein